MLVVRKFQQVCSRRVNIFRYSNITTSYEINFKPCFTREEEQRILEVINNEDLAKFQVPQNRIKKLKTWTNKKGPFRSLTDILEVDGLSVKALEKLCNNIVTNNVTESNGSSTEVNVGKIKRNFLTPPLTTEETQNLTNAVGLHIVPTGISWAKMTTHNVLESWNFYGFGSLPTKLLPHENFQLATELLRRIPPADIYVFEGASNNTTIQSGKTATISTHQLELSAMLTALINTSSTHNAYITKSDDSLSEDYNYFNRVYYLKSRLPARLFRTLVGNEKVSALNIVSSILENKCSLPYSPVKIPNYLNNNYFSQSSINKELLGQSLMLIITFMDICINKNPASINAVTNRQRVQCTK